MAAALDSDQYFGRILTGRVVSGTVQVGDKLNALDLSGKLIENGTILIYQDSQTVLIN